MFVREMTEEECIALLSAERLARLACSNDNQPYVVPIWYAYAGKCLYAFSMPGQKIEWMRANPRVCVEVDEISDRQHWKSVVVYGRYQELLDKSQWHHECLHAWSLLEKYPYWWEPGGLKPAPQAIVGASPHLFYGIYVDEMTGRAAVAEDAS